MLVSPGVWSGGGLTPASLNRAEIAARLPYLPRWVLDPLCDAFEAAFLASQLKASKQKRSADAAQRRKDEANG